MESAQDQLKKRGGATAESSGPARADVFDTVGNDGLKAHLDEARATATVEPEEPSMLSLVEAEEVDAEVLVEEVEDQDVVAEVLEEEDPAVAVEEVEAEETVPAELAAEEVVAPEVIEEEQPELAPQLAEEEQPVVAVEVEEPEVEELPAPEEVPEAEVATEAEEEVEAEKAEVIVEEVEPEKAPALAAMAGIDPVLATDPKRLGESEEAKEKALGAEGRKHLEEAVAATTASLGAGALDDNARALVTERLTEQLDVTEIVEARRDNRLEELVDDALRANALDARDQVITLVQQAARDANTLAKLAGAGDPAVALIEHLAAHLVEADDLVALAAYDHADLTKNLVMTDEALHVRRELSAPALRMGGFASVLYLLVSSRAEPLPDEAEAPGAEAAEAPTVPRDGDRAEAVRGTLLAVNDQLRLARTSAA